MKKVLFITYYWPPSGGAGVQRGLKFVKYLPEFGVEPIVLSVDPERASYPSLDPSLQREVPSGITIVRTDSFEPLRVLAAVGGKQAVPHAGFAGAKKEGLVARTMRWVRGNWMIPDARKGWVKHAVKAARPLIEREGIDTVVISSPPHSSQLIGLALKRMFPQLRWIADLRDPWTDIYFARELMKGGRARRIDAAYEKDVLSSADAIVVVGPSMKKSFVERYGPDVAGKITVIPNGYDAADLEPFRDLGPAGDRFTITYVGTMAASYNPRVLFSAVRECQQRADKPMALRFVGSVSEDIRAMAVAEGVDHLCAWIPTVPHHEAIREMALADVLLLVIPEGPGGERILTGKLFEYLGVGRPILGLGPVQGDAASIINTCQAGRMFERGDAAGLAAWISAYANYAPHPLNRERVSAYERRRGAEQLAGIILSL